MPAAPLIYCPIDRDLVLPEEQFELYYAGREMSNSLTIVPWRSLLAAGALDAADSIPLDARNATILKWEWEIPEINRKIVDLGFKTLFCTSTSKKWPIQNFAYPDWVKSSVYSNPVKNIHFSFVGWNNNTLRGRIFELYGHLPSVIKRDAYNSSERNKEHDTEFVDILSRSRFSLCPAGVGSGTRRIWESLKAGAIPVVISDDWVPPTCWDWSNTVLSLKKWQVLELTNKINVTTILPPWREEAMRANCYKASRAFHSHEFLLKYIDYTINANRK